MNGFFVTQQVLVKRRFYFRCNYKTSVLSQIWKCESEVKNKYIVIIAQYFTAANNSVCYWTESHVDDYTVNIVSSNAVDIQAMPKIPAL